MATTNGLLPKPLVSAEIATLRNDITRNYLGLFLEKQDAILKTKGGLGWQALELYEAVRDDSQVSSCMAQLLDSIVSYEVEIVPGQRKGSSVGRAEKKVAEFITELVDCLQYDRITRQTGWGFFYGYFVNELLLMRDGTTITLDDTKGGIRVRDRKRFQFDFDLNVKLLTPQNMWDGEFMHPSRVWTDNFGADHGDEPYGLGLAHFLYWLAVFKKGGFKAWLQFLERFASGTPVVKYPAGTDDDGKREAIEVAQAISSGSSLSMSDNLLLEIVEATRSGTADYSALVDKCDAAIAKVILGQTMTTDDGSSLSQAKVHENVGNKIIKNYADLLSESFNDNVVKRLCFWNFPDAMPPKVWRKTEPEKDKKAIAETDKMLFDMGFRRNLESVKEVYGEEFEEIPKEQPPAPIMPGDNVLPFPPNKQAENQFSEPDAMKLLAGSRDLVEFSERVHSVYPSMETGEFKTLMDKAAIVASKLGRI